MDSGGEGVTDCIVRRIYSREGGGKRAWRGNPQGIPLGQPAHLSKSRPRRPIVAALYALFFPEILLRGKA